MIDRKRGHSRISICLRAFLLILSLCPVSGWGRGDKDVSNKIDYLEHLNPVFVKEKRSSTRFIIIHTSEAGLSSTLRTLSKGKKLGKNYSTRGGHAHYAIARDGQVYEILSHVYKADHAGLSMWDGIENISDCSVGIELVGYHYDEITAEQYRSLSLLIKELQQVYLTPDKNVLTHSQVSYGEPNKWFKKLHRGRKRCALNFDRQKAGLTDSWSYDPDVKAGRLTADRQITRMFYDRRALAARVAPAATTTSASESPAGDEVSNIISHDNTAWNIAGEDCGSPDTIYILPGKEKKMVRGDRVEAEIGWDRLPPGTQVSVNQPLDREQKKGPIFQVSKDYTAWSFAGAAYRHASTFYFLPGDKVVSGNLIRDWDALPEGARLIIGYRGPFQIQNRQGQTAWGIAGRAYNHEATVYLIPGRPPVTGNLVEDFSDLPQGTKVFVKINDWQ